ncbi:MAG: flagellin lysine-N-methylase [Lachnospiraceae bacterium]|nr:flagellin lysine-N-methylase [Lachnospiraceae bacterium]
MVLKQSFYDDFVCIADRCPSSCCFGLDIELDKEETNRYFNAESELSKKFLARRDDGTSVIKHGESDGGCGFLTKEGLCSLVLKHGEMFLDHTCHVFPRFDYTYNDIKEKYLSNACPAVLDFLFDHKAPITFVATDEEDEEYVTRISDENAAYRDGLIDLMQISGFPLWFKFFLLKRYSDKLENKVGIDVVLGEMNDSSLNVKIFDLFPEMNVDGKKQLKLLYTILKSVINEEKRVPNKTTDLLYKCMRNADNLLADPDESVLKHWDVFKKEMAKYDSFFENICVNHLFMHSWYIHIMSEQNYTVKNLILECALIRVTLFLTYLLNDNEISKDDMFKIIVAYSRMFEHGREKTVGFIKENSDHICLSDAAFIEMIL